MDKILLHTFKRKVDEKVLISIKEKTKQIFVNSDIEYKLDIESEIVNGSRYQAGDVRYNIYLCVEEENLKKAQEIINEGLSFQLESETVASNINDVEELTEKVEDEMQEEIYNSNDRNLGIIFVIVLLIISLMVVVLALIKEVYVVSFSFALLALYNAILLKNNK